MTFQNSLLVLYGLVLVGLGIGLAGCLRSIRLLHGRIAESMGVPRRLSIGDQLSLPPAIGEAIGAGPYILLFGTASCRSCRQAIEAIRDHVRDAGIPAVGLGQSDVPPLKSPGDDYPHQSEVMASLNIGLLPFAVLIEHGKVAALGAIGSAAARREFLVPLPTVSAGRRATQHVS